MTQQPISVIYSRSDPAYSATTIVISSTISQTFVQSPLYDHVTGIQIGYKVEADHAVTPTPMSLTISFAYPANTPVVSTIVSGAGEYYGSQGTVRLFADSDGIRHVQFTLA